MAARVPRPPLNFVLISRLSTGRLAAEPVSRFPATGSTQTPEPTANSAGKSLTLTTPISKDRDAGFKQSHQTLRLAVKIWSKQVHGRAEACRDAEKPAETIRLASATTVLCTNFSQNVRFPPIQYRAPKRLTADLMLILPDSPPNPTLRRRPAPETELHVFHHFPPSSRRVNVRPSWPTGAI